MSPPGAIVGCDFAGVVESINGSSDCIKVGDRVASFVHGSMKPDRGSFAEYVKTDSSLLMKIPEGLSDEQASSVGIGGTTAVQVSEVGEREVGGGLTGLEWRKKHQNKL